ncbi:MAG: hypothetical protein CR982_00785 [Candidatus Cloacimonadota bacterium]|nr:MAG: hypothetical protein CR982_00785 [Candidatus Cloacimonadota bacterium]PIE78391.1 MAG: hypothetical protein CSA15_07935 [Candidatus Delongbacteria bacterium]
MPYKLIILLAIPYFLFSYELKSIRYGVHEKKRRVVLDFDKRVKYFLSKEESNLIFTVDSCSKSNTFKKDKTDGNLVSGYSVSEDKESCIVKISFKKNISYKVEDLTGNNFFKVVIDFKKKGNTIENDSKNTSREVIDKKLLLNLYEENDLENFIRYIKDYKKNNTLDDDLIIKYSDALFKELKKGKEIDREELIQLLKERSEKDPDNLKIKVKLAHIYNLFDKKYDAELIYNYIITSTPEIVDQKENNENKEVLLNNPPEINETTESIFPKLSSYEIIVYGSPILIIITIILFFKIRSNANKKFYENLDKEFDSEDADREEEEFKKGVKYLEDNTEENPVNPDQKSKVYELHNEGLSNKDIADALSLSVDAVSFLISKNGGVDNGIKREVSNKEKSYDISGLIPDIRKLYNENKRSREISDILKIDISDVNEVIDMISNENDEDSEDKSDQIKQLASEGFSKNQIAEKLKIGVDEVEFAASLFDIDFDEKNVEDLENIKEEDIEEEGLGFNDVDVRDVNSESDTEDDEDDVPLVMEDSYEFTELPDFESDLELNEINDEDEILFSDDLKEQIKSLREENEDLEENTEILNRVKVNNSFTDSNFDNKNQSAVENKKDSFEDQITEDIEKRSEFLTTETKEPLPQKSLEEDKTEVETNNSFDETNVETPNHNIENENFQLKDSYYENFNEKDIIDYRKNIQNRFSDIFDYNKNLLDKGSTPINEVNEIEKVISDKYKKENSVNDIPVEASNESSKVVDQSNIDALFANNGKSVEASNESSKVVDQSNIDALFANNGKSVEASNESSKVVDQSNIDALFANNGKSVEASNESSKVVDQSNIDALFANNGKSSEASNESSKVVDQSNIDALFANNGKSVEASNESSKVVDQSNIDALFANNSKKNNDSRSIQNISFSEKGSINSEISRIFSSDQLSEIKDIDNKDEDYEQPFFSEKEISNIISQEEGIEEESLESFKRKKMKDESLKDSVKQSSETSMPTDSKARKVFDLLEKGYNPTEVSQLMNISEEDATLYQNIKDDDI